MQRTYRGIIDLVLASGQRILRKAGEMADIGVTKRYLTEEDTIIERSIKEIVRRYHPTHQLYAEEEHTAFPDWEDIWVADPISGTKTFLEGLPHYAIAVAHLKNLEPQFSVVYDPSMDEMYTAFMGKGTYLNGRPIRGRRLVAEDRLEVVFNLSYAWMDHERGSRLLADLSRRYRVFSNKNSFAVNYCHVAAGRYDGFVALTKDAFPEIAANLIVKEAGCLFNNKYDEHTLEPHHRVFFGGSHHVATQLSTLVCPEYAMESV